MGATGPQPDPLREIVVPPNAICAPSLPQLDILNIGVDLFLTHCGQNSFMEALANSTPLVCCPGFGDQIVNARKAVDLGVGLNIERPDPRSGSEELGAMAYRRDVSEALRRVFTESSFKASAVHCAENLRAAGGVPQAVDLILKATKIHPAAEASTNPMIQQCTSLSAAGA